MRDFLRKFDPDTVATVGIVFVIALVVLFASLIGKSCSTYRDCTSVCKHSSEPISETTIDCLKYCDDR